jgi:hypothetical protein
MFCKFLIGVWPGLYEFTFQGRGIPATLAAFAGVYLLTLVIVGMSYWEAGYGISNH